MHSCVCAFVRSFTGSSKNNARRVESGVRGLGFGVHPEQHVWRHWQSSWGGARTGEASSMNKEGGVWPSVSGAGDVRGLGRGQNRWVVDDGMTGPLAGSVDGSLNRTGAKAEDRRVACEPI